MAKRKRRTKAEMAALQEVTNKNGKIREKIEKGEISDAELILSAIPKVKEKEYVYLDKEVPVIKELRILKDNQGTEMSVTEIVKAELDTISLWEYKNIPINEFSVKDLPKLGKDGWKYAFDLSPTVTTSVKVTTLIFQRPAFK